MDVLRIMQEKAAKSQKMAENTIKWVMGPNGTVVTFPANVGLPSIFNSKPHRSVYLPSHSDAFLSSVNCGKFLTRISFYYLLFFLQVPVLLV